MLSDASQMRHGALPQRACFKRERGNRTGLRTRIYENKIFKRVAEFNGAGAFETPSLTGTASHALALLGRRYYDKLKTSMHV